MKRYQREIVVDRDVAEVFDFFADMSRLGEWAPEDFVSVRRLDRQPIAIGTRFSYVTRGARVESTFGWTQLDRPNTLVFTGPPVDVGPGWVEGLGGYSFERTTGGTTVRAWFEPTLGGLLALMSPFARLRNIRLLGRQLARAKALIEGGALAATA